MLLSLLLAYVSAIVKVRSFSPFLLIIVKLRGVLVKIAFFHEAGLKHGVPNLLLRPLIFSPRLKLKLTDLLSRNASA